MMLGLNSTLTAAVLGAGLAIGSIPVASAAPAAGAGMETARQIAAGQAPATFAQYRGRRGGYRGHRGYRRGYYGRPYGYRRGHGAAIGAGVAGLAAGAILGGALAAQAQPAPVYGGDAVAYCAQRFRSYDPASGTYLGYDGRRHACP